MYSEPLIRKFQADEEFRQFVLVQYNRQNDIQRGLKKAKEPHPFAIPERQEPDASNRRELEESSIISSSKMVSSSEHGEEEEKHSIKKSEYDREIKG